MLLQVSKQVTIKMTFLQYFDSSLDYHQNTVASCQTPDYGVG